MPISISDKILRNTGWNLAARLIHFPVSIAIVPFIINRVGAEWYGVWVALFALVDYISFLDLGVGAATVKYVAEHKATGHRPGIGDIVLSTCVFNLIFIPPLALCYWFSDPILDFFTIPVQDIVEARFLFGWVLLNFAVTQFASVFRNALIGLQRMHVSTLCEIGYLLAYAMSTLLVLGCDGGLTGLIVVLFGLRCLSGMAYAACLLRAVPELWRDIGRFDSGVLRDFFRYGLKVQMNSLAGCLNFQLDKLLIGHFLRMEFVAFYELGSKLAMVVRLFPSVMLAPLIPAAAELAAARDSGRLEELYSRSTRYMGMLSAPVMVFMVTMAPIIMSAWLGNGSTPEAVLALQVLAVGYFCNIMAGPALSIGRGIGVLRYEIQATALIAFLNLLLSITLVLQAGFAGALIGTGTAMAFGNLVYIIRFYRFLRPATVPFIWGIVGKPLVCACAAGGGLRLAMHAFGQAAGPPPASREGLLLWLSGAGILYAAMFAALLVKLKCLTRAERDLAGQLRRSMRMMGC